MYEEKEWGILNYIISHMYFKGIQVNGINTNMSPRIRKVLYFAAYIVIDEGNSNLEYKQVINETEYRGL